MKYARAIAVFSISLLALPAAMSQSNVDFVMIKQIAVDFDISELDNKAWKAGKSVEIQTYWSGKKAPEGRRFRAVLLWSLSSLYVRFEARQNEPLVVSGAPNLTSKTIGLWDRDVCELFIAPDRSRPNKYFEFEIAPTGEWIDLGIEVLPKERRTDWEYKSGMESAACVRGETVVMAIRIPFASLGKSPKVGDVWLGNLFRCVGTGPTRGYLAWWPTKTAKPNFHVPEAFGEFVIE